jgi:Zn-dependent peptidase ImmA (M78 family)
MERRRIETHRANVGVSRQALLLRLVTLNLASWHHYKEWQTEFEEEYRQLAEDRAKKQKIGPYQAAGHAHDLEWARLHTFGAAQLLRSEDHT